jgi:hypothetical protein
MSDQELEHVLNEALILFRYTHGGCSIIPLEKREENLHCL